MPLPSFYRYSINYCISPRCFLLVSFDICPFPYRAFLRTLHGTNTQLKNMTKNLSEDSILTALAKVTDLSLDTMSNEDRDYFANQFDLKFNHATSNQAIVFNNWVVHPENIREAIEIVNNTYPSTPVEISDPVINDYIESIIIQAIAITGRNQLSGIKGCSLSQVLPKLAYDEKATYDYALKIAEAYAKIGVDKSKFIIKIPITWEAMHAAKKLHELHGIQCLGTVCHSLEQAVLAAEAKCVFISPYVDTLEVNLNPASYVPTGDLKNHYGFQITKKIHKYYKAHGVKDTKICIAATMGLDIILGLSGIDAITAPVIALNKMINTKVPKDAVIPALAQTYTVEEAGPKLSFLDSKDVYYSSLNSSPVALKRINFANETFDSFHDKSVDFIKNVLIEYGYVN